MFPFKLHHPRPFNLSCGCGGANTPADLYEKRAAEQAVRKGEAPISWSLFFWSSESCPKLERTNEIDCAQDVVGQDAESGFGFGFDFGDASGEEPPVISSNRDRPWNA
jgi:hypothetical protein